MVELAIGFIIGSRAIEYLRESGQTSIRWRFRVYHKRVEEAGFYQPVGSPMRSRV